jgi:hypothetical protein
MMKIFLLYIFFLILPFVILGQRTLGISSGISIDINNNGKFKQVPLSVEWIPGKSKKGAFIIQTTFAVPLNNKSYDSAYTIGSGLPPAVAIEKDIKNFWFSGSIGVRFLIPTGATNDFVIDFFPLGVSQQIFKITYKNYNNTDYEVINPDVNLNRWGYVCSLGIGYIRDNFIGKINFQTPLAASEGRYKLSYRLNAPLQITIGYLLKLTKTKQQ